MRSFLRNHKHFSWLLAAALGVPFAIVTGGVATVALTLLIAWKYPILRRFDQPVAAAAAA